VKHPILRVLADQGRSMVWLGRQVDRHPKYLSQVFHGHEPAVASLRTACARALGVPESLLFHGGSDAGRRGGRSSTGSDSDRADTVVAASVAAG
jgi:hypothetical protein